MLRAYCIRTRYLRAYSTLISHALPISRHLALAPTDLAALIPLQSLDSPRQLSPSVTGRHHTAAAAAAASNQKHEKPRINWSRAKSVDLLSGED